MIFLIRTICKLQNQIERDHGKAFEELHPLLGDALYEAEHAGDLVRLTWLTKVLEFVAN